ncbi:MAG: tRNA (adenosine(37)-N6)-dimethylallyltransferase MiaA [Leptospirales bacterium]|nr:tRNA (adenosine(37)-N6)-dimethylallyltransferase MiaA [Leptospirales bacterium]
MSLAAAGELFEVISFDSVQIYRNLDIGSGKLPPLERGTIPHHGIDIIDPDEDFTAGDFARYAAGVCEEIRLRKNIPLFVGGTGFYLDSFFQGLSGIPVIDPVVRSDVRADIELRGVGVLYNELASVDPFFARTIHPNDSQRIIRGLEVYRGTGRPISWFYQGKNGYESNETLYIGLYDERELLNERINKRVDSMIVAGFVDEVRKLREMGYGPELKSMKSIGYAEINCFLDGLAGFDETIELIKKETRRYAKRQMTWFRKNKKITWFKAGERDAINQHIEKWLK